MSTYTPPFIQMFVVGESPMKEGAFVSKTFLPLLGVDSISRITARQAVIVVFFLIPGHEKHRLWPEIKELLDNTPYYKVVNITEEILP